MPKMILPTLLVLAMLTGRLGTIEEVLRLVR
ncbi:hypothetical protein V1273_006062 [Bradyrhizobium sp. AZCC 1721]